MPPGTPSVVLFATAARAMPHGPRAAQGLVLAYYNLFSIARIPDAAFRGAARVIFTLALPVLLVANVPVKAPGLSSHSTILLNQIRSVDKMRLGKRLGRMKAETMEEVDRAVQISLGLVEI